MKPFVFGTDGWRAVMGEDYTEERVAVVAHAIGLYLQRSGDAARGVAVGYDNRLGSEKYAVVVAAALTQQGISVTLSDRSVPSPTLSYAVVDRSLGGGVMITASHNPAQWNGVKLKASFGGSALPGATREVAEIANGLLSSAPRSPDRSGQVVALPMLDTAAILTGGPDSAFLQVANLSDAYIERLLTFVDVKAIQARKLRLLVDPLYGSSIGVLDRTLVEAGCRVIMIHGERDTLFGGLNPEPIAVNMKDLLGAMSPDRYDGGVASDGDGDRLAACTEEGGYLSPQHVFALLLMHLAEDKHLHGIVVKTVSTTRMIDRLAERNGLPLQVTPVGFKYICDTMLRENVLIGGEESGGVGFRGHIPERDATLQALYLAEMAAMRETTFAGLLRDLQAVVGPHAYDRRDLHLTAPLTDEGRATLRTALCAPPPGWKESCLSEQDGLKVTAPNGEWLLLRPSGTEPLLRLYAEAPSAGRVAELLDYGEELLAKAGVELIG